MCVSGLFVERPVHGVCQDIINKSAPADRFQTQLLQNQLVCLSTQGTNTSEESRPKARMPFLVSFISFSTLWCETPEMDECGAPVLYLPTYIRDSLWVFSAPWRQFSGLPPIFACKRLFPGSTRSSQSEGPSAARAWLALLNSRKRHGGGGKNHFQQHEH